MTTQSYRWVNPINPTAHDLLLFHPEVAGLKPADVGRAKHCLEREFDALPPERRDENYLESNRYHPELYDFPLAILQKHIGIEGHDFLDLGYGEVPFLMALKREGATTAAGLDKRVVPELSDGLELVQGDINNLDAYFEGRQFDAIVAKDVFTEGMGWPKHNEYRFSQLDPSHGARYMVVLLRTMPTEPAYRQQVQEAWEARYQRISPELLDLKRRVCQTISDKLKPGGVFIIQNILPSFIYENEIQGAGLDIIVPELRVGIDKNLILAEKPGGCRDWSFVSQYLDDDWVLREVKAKDLRSGSDSGVSEAPRENWFDRARRRVESVLGT